MIKTILKGVVIGISNVIPGVSGGTMAVSMGIYDKIIYAVTHLFSEFKKSMQVLLPLVIGMAIAIVGGARLIEYFFRVAPFQTNLLFIGLIVGGLPAIFKKVKGNTLKSGYIALFFVFMLLVVGLAALGEGSGSSVHLSFTLINVIKLFGVGVVASATMVIPGVSGSMMLMVMGYYSPILSSINKFIDDLLKFDLEGLISGCVILLPFGIGVVVGIFAIAKAIEIVFAKFPLYAFWAIIGLIVASPIGILMMNQFKSLHVVTILTGVAALAAGIAVAMKLGEE